MGCILAWCNIHAQYYSLEYNEPEFLSIPDPPYNGYVAHATWNVNNSNLSFDGHDEAGAIIYPNHYFEGSSVVTCNYRYEYYRNGRTQSGTGVASYTISFKSNNATLSKSELSMPVGKTEKLTYQLERSYNSSNYGSPKMTWESNRESVATVDKNGKVTAVGPGSATITFDPVVGPPVYCQVTVINNPPTAISLPSTSNTKVGESVTLTPTLTPSDAYATIKWKSSDENVATVSGGKVTGKSVGKTKITATTDNNLSAECEVTVEKGTVTVTADTESGLYASGKTIVLKASHSDADIYYTLNGSTPTTSSTRYTGQITLTRSVTLKAIATGSNYETSDVLTKQYQVTSLTAKNYWDEGTEQSPFFIPVVTFSKEVSKGINVGDLKLAKGYSTIAGLSIVQDGKLYFVPDNKLEAGSYTLTIPENAVMDNSGEPNLAMQLKLVIGKGFEATPIQVSASISHSIALMSDNTLWAWGSNYDYQLGDGTSTRRLKPIKVFDDVIQACAGDGGGVFTCAIKTDKTLWKWGADIKTKQKVMDDAAFVASANQAVKTDGTLYNHNTNEAILDNVAEYAAYSHYLAVKKDGSLWVWGQNKYGQLGDGTTTDITTPVKIMEDVVHVAVGWRHSLALKKDGSLWAWGENGGSIGDGTSVNRLKPVKVMDNVTYISANRYSSFAIKTDGTLWAWGNNLYGLLGDGTTTRRLSPVKIMDDVAQVATGWTHTLAIKKDGSLWTWGGNDGGELGDGTTKGKTSPVCIMSATSFNHVTGISLQQTTHQMSSGSQYLLLPNFMPDKSSCETIEFESSNPQIASVSSRGIVEAKAIGKATITVKVDGKYTATCEITVKARDIDVVMSADGYATFYDSEQAFSMPSGISAQLVTGVSNSKITYQKLSGSIIPKNVPVMLINNSRRAGTYTLTASDSKDAYNGTNLLKGSDVPTKTTGTGYHYKLSFGPNGTQWNDVFGWYWGATDGGSFQIEGHKAWLVVPKSAATRGYTIEGDATGIEEYMQSENENVVYYDMQGRRIDKPVRSGIYIVNGKKIVVK